MKVKKRLFTGLLAFAIAMQNMPLPSVHAAFDAVRTNEGEETVTLAEFDFDELSGGEFDGGSAKAVISGTAANLTQQDHAENGKSVKFGSGAYLSVTAKDGKSLLKGWEDVTISFDLKPSESTSWILYAAPNDARPSWPNEKYFGLLKPGKNTGDDTASKQGTGFVVQRIQNNGARPDSASAEGLVIGDWNHVEVHVEETKTTLTVNGDASVSCNSSYLFSDVLKEGNVLWLGRANWSGGEYSDMELDNLKITGRIADSVTMPEAVSVTEGKSRILTVSGISRYADAQISYTSSNPAAAPVDAATGKVTGRAAGTAEITASVVMGTARKELKTAVTVEEKQPAERVFYLDFNDGSIGGASAAANANGSITDYTGAPVFEDGGRTGKAVRLNGYGLRLNRKNEGADYTVSLWIKHDGNLSENQQILFMGSGSPENWLDIAGGRGSGNAYQIWTRNATPSSAISGWNYLDESVKQKAGEWTMVTVTGDGTDFAAYFNGEPAALDGSGKSDATVQNAANVLNGENQDIYIGVNNWDKIFGGLVDDVAVYNRDMTAEEVKALYDQQYTEYAAEYCSIWDLSEKLTENLTLPSQAAENVAVSWSSSHPAILSDTGVVARPAADTEVTLTGTFVYGSGRVEKQYKITVAKEDASADLTAAADALSLCTVTDKDLNLPESGIRGTAIRWKSSDTSVMSDGGAIVSRPAQGAANAKVTLTATIEKNGEMKTKAFPLEILAEYYGYIYGYITGDNDRTGSLHLACSRDGKAFTALNSNEGIHFAQIDSADTGNKSLNTGMRFAEVSLFRKADGKFGLAAVLGKDPKQLYFYDSDDLIAYRKETLVPAGGGIGNLSDVVVSYDALISGYYVYWKNGTKKYANTTKNFEAVTAARESDYTVPSVNAVLPQGAKRGSVIGVTKAEYEKIEGRFGGVKYRETAQAEAVTVQTADDVKDALPSFLNLSYSDGSSSSVQAEWDTDTPDFSKAGTYTVEGRLRPYKNPLISERPDPQVSYDEESGLYYFTSSYPAYKTADKGYDRILLRTADTIQGLSAAKDVEIWKAPASGKMAKHVWAPELQKIGGKWYVFFAAGNSEDIWAIRPYVLVCQDSANPKDAESWKKSDGSAEIHAAASADGSYFSHMSLDMTYLENNGKHYVIWAEKDGASRLYMQEINPDRPWMGTGGVICLTEPDYGWEREGEIVNEGPAVLKHDGKIFCAYSASGTGPEYCIGVLYAKETSDLMNPDSWVKLPYPLLTSKDVPGEYGPGHNSFTTDAGGNPVFVYHARSEECYQDQCAYADADPLYDPCRHARVKNVHWSADGLPVLNMNAEEEIPEDAEHITVQVTVRQDSAAEKRDLSQAVISGVEENVIETGSQICPQISVKWGTAELKEGTDYTVSYGANKTGTGSVFITAAENGRYTGSKTVEFRILASQIAEFSFDNMAAGLTGGNAKAEAAEGSVELTDHDGGKAAKFVKNEKDCLKVTSKDGGSLLTGYDEFTVSCDIMLPETSGTNWVYFIAPDDENMTWDTHGNKERYLGVLVKDGFLEAERYQNNGSRPKNPKAEVKANTWQHMDIVYAKDATAVYLDGRRAQAVKSRYGIQNILGTKSWFWIGRASWSGGEYASMQLDNFKITAGAKMYEEDKISQAQKEIEERLGDLTSVTEDLELLKVSSDGVLIRWTSDNPAVLTADGKITVPNADTAVGLTAVIGEGKFAVTKHYTATVVAAEAALEKLAAQLTLPYSMKKGTEVYGNITLPETVNGKGSVVWETDHPEIVNVNEIPGTDGYDPAPAGTVTRPKEDTAVTMTAKVSMGAFCVEKEFTFKVKAAPKVLSEDDYTDYFFAYFTGEGHADGEQVYFAASRDGLNWKDLNENNPVLNSALGEKGVRDPFIIRSPEGDKFYLIATDLKINGGSGWTAAQERGSQALMIWESTDLVNWSKQRMVTVSADIEAGCTWAPEAAYDKRTGEYVVYWASKVKADNYAKHRLYYAKTRDFYSFTEPKVYIDYDQSSIDTTMIEHNGVYYRYTKNEGGSTNQLGALTKNIFIEKGSDVLGTFTQILSDTLTSGTSNQYVEGPTIYKLNKDDAKTDTWCLLVDDFGGGGYYPLLTDDLDSGEFTRPDRGEYKLPGSSSRFPRHGTPIRITAEEYQAVAEAYGMEKEKVTVYAAAYQNAKDMTETTLPEKVTVGGEEKRVTWSWPGTKFASPYQTVEVRGDIGDPMTEVTAKVEVIPAKENPLAYFVDVSRTEGKESKAFEEVAKLTPETLKNKTADQKYSEQDKWGRDGDYNEKSVGNIDVSDKSQTGLFGENGDTNSLTWRYYLEAGTYTLTAGIREWWDGPRSMRLKLTGTKEDVTSDVITVSKSDPVKTESLTFEVASDGIVTMSVENEQGSDAPALSWFAVAKGEVTGSLDRALTEIVIDGADVAKAARNVNGLTWKGYGLLSGNSTSDLLMDYKQEAPEAYAELLQELFGGGHPLMNHVKIEMGNDGNNSTGADSCTMRFENEEADASRSPGFALAADAKAVNQDVKVSFLRWEMPAWVKEAWDRDKTGAGYEAVYKWYKETIFDAYEKYGYVVDYVDPDKNETSDPDEDFIKWFKNRVVNETEFPAYMDKAAQDAYHGIKIIASDENTTLNIVPSMRSDMELYEAVDAVGFHYSTGTKDSTADYRAMADRDDKEVWYSEGCAAFSYTEYQENKQNAADAYGNGSVGGYQSPLALADNLIASYIYSRKTHYIFQPAVGSFYEGAQYDHKELISAREPWAGYIHYDPSIYMLWHFAKFAKTGWENEENTAGVWRAVTNASGNASANRGDLGHITNESGNPSYLTLAAPDKSAFSVVIVNNSEKTVPYAIKAQNMGTEQGAALEIWETKTDSYMQYKGEASYANGYYELTAEPYSMVTLTTLDCSEKEEYLRRLPKEREKAVLDTDQTGAVRNTEDKYLYADDFSYENYSADYLRNRGNEPRYAVDFSGAWAVEDGRLKQLLGERVNEWNPNEPNTVIGDFRWMNYKAGVDVTVTGEGYAGLNIRQQTGMGFEGSGYNLRIAKDGSWILKKRSGVIGSGNVDARKDGSYRLELEGKGGFITASIDGGTVMVYNDPNPEYFGRVRLGSSWNETEFDNLTVEAAEGYEPYAVKLIDNASDDIAYEGAWNIIAGAHGSNYDWYRSASTALEAGVSFEFSMDGGGFALIGENDGTGVLDIEADGEKIMESAKVRASGKHGASYVQYGLSDGMHKVKVTVKSGAFVLDAVQFLPYLGEDSADRVVSADSIYGAAFEGEAPKLPDMAVCVKANGQETAERVIWDTEHFHGKAYETAQAFGVTAESGVPVSAKVEVIPQRAGRLVYFVDAGRDAGSPSNAFDAVSSITDDTLKNKTADQEFDGESGWGRAAEKADTFQLKNPAADTDVTDKYQTGWYSNTKTDWLKYKLYLEKGSYELTAGFHEWWNNRSMKISVSCEGAEKVTSDPVLVSGVGDNASGSVSFDMKQDGYAVLEIENADGGEAPVISWFGVVMADKEALEKELVKYAGLKEENYTKESWEIFADAKRAAEELLFRETVSVKEISGALRTLSGAYQGLVENEERKAAKESLKSVLAQYENLNAADYTKETYQAFLDALEAAKAALTEESFTKDQIKAAQAALTEAFGKLEKIIKKDGLPPVPPVQKKELLAPSVKSVKSAAQKSGTEVKITVNPVANADFYTVYRKISGKVTVIGTTKTGILKDKKPVSGKRAFYYASASSENTENYADSKTGGQKSITLAADTKKVTVKSLKKAVKVTFQKVKKAKGYLIYRSAKKKGPYVKLTKKPVKKLAYVDKKVKAKKTYYYKVVTYGSGKTYSAGKTSKKIKVK